jgi:predicted dehydrogenase/flavin reductase (DIM6/NTAB) family NADH-FMN oxidoreductase RutF
MILPSRTIWDTRIQCICSIVLVRDGAHLDAWLCGNYGQASLDPPRIIVNPNRLFPIESIILAAGRFSLNVLPETSRDELLRFMSLRRRDPQKMQRMGWRLDEDHGIPFLPDAIRTVFCELETSLPTGDHTVILGRVIESRVHALGCPAQPLMYRDVAGAARTGGAAMRRFRDRLRSWGVFDVARRVLLRGRGGSALPNLRENTYREGGQTEAEIERIASYGLLDHGRVLDAPRKPERPKRHVGICVVGTHWGSFHCKLVREADPSAGLFVCGRDRGRTEQLARAMKADGAFTGLESALRDSRVEAVTLALPHYLHQQAAEAAMAAGKHVLVEKPIATTLAAADAMIGAARRARRILMVAEDMHFRPTLALARRLIDAGDIGEPLQMFAQTGGMRRPEGWALQKDRLGGGVFMDLGVHYVRAMRMLMGEPDAATAFPGMQINTKMQGEDSLGVVFRSRFGWTAHLFATWSANLGIVPDIVVLGECGTLHLWPCRAYLDYYPAAPRPMVRILSFVRPYSLQEKLIRPAMQRVRMRLSRQETTGYIDEMREFLSAIAEDREPATTACDARRDLEIILACYQAMETGQEATIPPGSTSPPPSRMAP